MKTLLLIVFVGLVSSPFVALGKTLVFSSGQSDFFPADDTCGYESCNPVKEGMINVHVVPHTHDDVGWLMTVDQYYYQRVQYILDTVIPQLEVDPSRRFIYVEIAFFKRWWDEQDDTMRHIVKGLVNQGRLEFILGGWSMNDEASTHYNAIIDQHTLGFRFLQDTFGECARPRVAWQIDPFGHSREQASLFAQMGFDGLFFGRLDYQDKDYRVNTSTMEMVWEGSDDLGTSSSLFTGALYDGYGPPPNICFSYDCSDPVMDDESLHDYNVPQKVDQFLKDVADQAKHYATHHLIMTMGSDFEYTDALTWFKNLNKIIKYVNEQQTVNNTKVNLLYSTPSCYLKQLNLASKTWTTKSDDFFPYTSRAHTVWTGYFTSRAALKGYVRRTNNFLQDGGSTMESHPRPLNFRTEEKGSFQMIVIQVSEWNHKVCKQMDALAQLEDSQHSSVSIEVLKEAMGLAQHHDGISGTEKQPVAYDYAERLANGVNECGKTINDAYKKLLSKSGADVPFDQLYCGLLNISMCDVTENNQQFVMLAYNPIGRQVTRWVRLPVLAGSYNVTDPDGNAVDTQLLPVSARTSSIPERKSKATHELVFSVTIPALGFASYFVQMTSGVPDQSLSEFRELDVTGSDTVLKNKHISLTFNDAGQLSAMANLDSQVAIELKQEFAYYTGFVGNSSKPEFQASGAYVFRPNEMEPHTFNSDTSVKRTRIAQGTLVQEVEQTFSPWVSQVIRLYEDTKFAELEWTVGPISIDDKVGKEIVNRIQTGMKTERTFFTDANGRQILKRVIDYRPTWRLNQTEPVAGNYYPVNSKIFIKCAEKNAQFAVLADRSEGGASLREGEIEIMVHRRLLHDDALGVGEPLNETGSDGKGLIVRGKQYLMLNMQPDAARFERDMALQLYMSPELSFVSTTMSYSQWSDNYRTRWSGLNRQLPPNVHLLSLEQWKGSSYLARFEHLYQSNEDSELSQPVNISMTGLFATFDVDSAEELMLGANQKKSDSHRLVWETAGEYAKQESASQHSRSDGDSRDVSLSPMQIRTYQLTLSSDQGNGK